MPLPKVIGYTVWNAFPNSRGVVKTHLEKKLDVRMFRALLRRRNSGPAVPTWGLAFFIQSSFKFVPYLLLTSTRNTIFTKFSSFLNHICLYGELQKSIGFTVNLFRMCVMRDDVFCSSRFPRLPVRSAFLCGSHHVVECRCPVLQRVLPRRYAQSGP